MKIRVSPPPIERSFQSPIQMLPSVFTPSPVSASATAWQLEAFPYQTGQFQCFPYGKLSLPPASAAWSERRRRTADGHQRSGDGDELWLPWSTDKRWTGTPSPNVPTGPRASPGDTCGASHSGVDAGGAVFLSPRPRLSSPPAQNGNGYIMRTSSPPKSLQFRAPTQPATTCELSRFSAWPPWPPAGPQPCPWPWLRRRASSPAEARMALPTLRDTETPSRLLSPRPPRPPSTTRSA